MSSVVIRGHQCSLVLITSQIESRLGLVPPLLDQIRFTDLGCFSLNLKAESAILGTFCALGGPSAPSWSSGIDLGASTSLWSIT